MFIVNEIQVINEYSTFPMFTSNYQVVNVQTGNVELTAESEDKAYALAFQMNNIANLRDL